MKLWAKKTRKKYHWERRQPVSKEKIRAHNAVYRAIKKGILKKMPCRDCKGTNVHSHHSDYSKPLMVIWLCPQRHKDEHAKLNYQTNFTHMKKFLVTLQCNDEIEAENVAEAKEKFWESGYEDRLVNKNLDVQEVDNSTTMQTFKVLVTELAEKEIEVKAESLKEAYKEAQALHANGEIRMGVTGGADFRVSFQVQNPDALTLEDFK